MPLSPALTAKFGCEIEVGGVRVSAPAGATAPSRGTVLLERPLWNLETDNVGPGEYDLEAVFKPLSSDQEVAEAMGEIVALFQRLRETALESEGSTIALSAIAPEAKGDYQLSVRDIGLSATLQSTYGIRLDDLEQVIQEILPTQAGKVRDRTEAVAARYSERHGGKPLPPGARQFTSLVNLYLACAQTAKVSIGQSATAHTEFRMMTRSDFCAIHDKLLEPEDREAVKSLFVTSEGDPVPAFMQALGMHDPDQQVFAKGYKVSSDQREQGPTIKAWLHSVVDGRDDGDFRKDLLSPPPGYPLHTGDLSKDYGMGAMGVDEAQGRLLVEWRGAPYRPRNIPMNGQIVRAVRQELGRAAALNETLDVQKRGAIRSAKFELLDGAASVVRSLKVTTDDVEGRLARSGNGGLPFFRKGLTLALDRLAALDRDVSKRTGSAWAPGLRACIAKVQAAGSELSAAAEAASSPDDLTDGLVALRAELGNLEARLWDAGKTSG